MNVLRSLFAITGLLVLPYLGRASDVIVVTDDASLRKASGYSKAGTKILVAPGEYGHGFHVYRRRGTKDSPIVIEGQDPSAPPTFRGGPVAFLLTGCEHLVLRNLHFSGQTGNGLNAGDGSNPNAPGRFLRFEQLNFSDIGTPGKNIDGLKMAGIHGFEIRNCTFNNVSGQAIDLVGCHQGVIENCEFRNSPVFVKGYAYGIQIKGGSSHVQVRKCLFDRATARGVNIGGQTGPDYFRPRDALYEATDITVEGCVFLGDHAAVAYAGSNRSVVRYNTIVRPTHYLLRILQENTRREPCSNGRFERNLIVYRRSQLREGVNVGRGTRPETFSFSNNFWYCEDQPSRSEPRLPTREIDGVYGVNPDLVTDKNTGIRPQNHRAAAYGAHALDTSGTADTVIQNNAPHVGTSPQSVYFFARSRISKRAAAVTFAVAVFGVMGCVLGRRLWRGQWTGLRA